MIEGCPATGEGQATRRLVGAVGTGGQHSLENEILHQAQTV